MTWLESTTLIGAIIFFIGYSILIIYISRRDKNESN